MNVADTSPGDIVFCHGKGFLSAAIRLGERIRGHGKDSYWNHTAIVVDPAEGRPRVAQATSKGVVISWLSDLDLGYEVVQAEHYPALCGQVSRREIVTQAYKLVGAKYGWLTIFSIVLNLLTPKWFRFPDFRRGSTFICSAAAAFCLHAGGADLNTDDIYQVFPSELRAFAR